MIQLPLRTIRSRRVVLLCLAIFAPSVLLVCAGLGALAISPAQALAILCESVGISTLVAFTEAQQAVLMSIRLPRVVLGSLVGSGLALSGAALQGLFRNPLADPGLMGLSSGAALAAFAVFVLGGSWLQGMPVALGHAMLPLAAFIGALGALGVVYALARDGRNIQVTTLLLAGIAVNAMCQAGVGIFSFVATDAQMRDFVFWSLGSLGGANWPALLLTMPLFLFGMVMLLRMARSLNALALGEAEANHLGAPVERLKLGTALVCTLVVGTSVSLCGAIGFVGLVVPHLARMVIGPDHRWLLPASMLGGAVLLPLADLAARTVAAPAEIPIGVLTAITGGPFFLWLLVRSRRSQTWT